MSLEERLFKSFDDQQKVEHEAREIETLINSFDGTAGLLLQYLLMDVELVKYGRLNHWKVILLNVLTTIKKM